MCVGEGLLCESQSPQKFIPGLYLSLACDTVSFGRFWKAIHHYRHLVVSELTAIFTFAK